MITTFLTYSSLLGMLAVQLLSVILKRYVNIDTVKTNEDVRNVSNGFSMSPNYLTPKGRRIYFWRNVLFFFMVICIFSLMAVTTYPKFK
jgi:hypothetical protein